MEIPVPAVLKMKRPDTVVGDIECEVGKEEERRARLFSRWQSEKGAHASYKQLINALLEIECMQDAEYVCWLIRSTVANKVSPKVLEGR